MFSEETVSLRRKLRQCIADSVPGASTAIIYQRLKARFAPNLTQDDLVPFCEAVNIPKEKLPMLLEPYGITERQISQTNWRKFYENEFCSTQPVLPIPQTLTKDQVRILSKFAEKIRLRTDSTIANQWMFVISRNPSGSPDGRVRISAFCRLVDELDLAFNNTALIDAMLAFFGRKTDSLDFNEFAVFMQTFQ